MFLNSDLSALCGISQNSETEMILKSRWVAPVACLEATGVARHKKLQTQTNMTPNKSVRHPDLFVGTKFLISGI